MDFHAFEITFNKQIFMRNSSTYYDAALEQCKTEWIYTKSFSHVFIKKNITFVYIWHMATLPEHFPHFA